MILPIRRDRNLSPELKHTAEQVRAKQFLVAQVLLKERKKTQDS